LQPAEKQDRTPAGMNLEKILGAVDKKPRAGLIFWEGTLRKFLHKLFMKLWVKVPSIF
jgi:hypothetical protein